MYRVHSDGRAILLSGPDDTITFQISGPLEADRDRLDFAVWALLPIAMRYGHDLQIAGSGDPAICESAHRLSRVWETWMPNRFRSISVRFDAYSEPKSSHSNVDLVFYSGGVDSTYNLLCRQAAGKSQSLLTVQGMDFDYDNDEGFAALIKKTAAFAESVSKQRLFVKHNLYSVYKRHGIDAGVSHGFALTSSAFLFSSQFGACEIAADDTRAQEYLTHPWGTNSLTNSLFAGTHFRLNTANLDVSRAEKLPLIAASPLALRALTFCQNRKSLPENCGRCSKCVRTKAMFMVSIGHIPSMIFADASFDEGILASLRLDKKFEQSCLLELFVAARERGALDKVPGLVETANQLFKEPRPRLSQRVSQLLRALIGTKPGRRHKRPRPPRRSWHASSSQSGDQ